MRRRQVKIGLEFGDWKVVAHDRDDIWQVECPAGHKLLRASGLLLLTRKVGNKCLECRRYEANKDLIGQTSGNLTVIGLVTRPLKKASRSGQNACYLACRCVCGQMFEYLNRDWRRGDVTGKDCPGCRELKLKAAAVTNQTLDWPEERLAAVKKGIRTGIASVLIGVDRQEADDVTGLVWAELLTYPNHAVKSTGQIAQAAWTLAKRISLSHILGIRERQKMEKNPPKNPVDFGDEPDSCVFDNLNVDDAKQEPTDEMELQRFVYDQLSADDRQFLLDYSTQRGVKSKPEKLRFVTLSEQCREKHKTLAAEIGVPRAA